MFLENFQCRLEWVGGTEVNLGVSQEEGPQYRPQYAIVLIIGIRKKVFLILGNTNPYNLYVISASISCSLSPMAPNPKDLEVEVPPALGFQGAQWSEW